MKNRILLLVVLSVFVVMMFAAAASGQDDAAVVAETLKAELAKHAGYLEVLAEKRRITVAYVDAAVEDKVKRTKKALADNDFDRAFVRNSEIMLLIHKKRESVKNEDAIKQAGKVKKADDEIE